MVSKQTERKMDRRTPHRSPATMWSLSILFVFFVLASSMVSALSGVSSSNTYRDLTDTVNWGSGGCDLFANVYDSINDLVYMAGCNRNFQFYNRTSNITTKLNNSFTGGWIGSTYMRSLAYDSINDLVYIGAESGKFGVYNRTSNIATNLSGTFTGNWMNTSKIFSLAYNTQNGLIYISGDFGKFGVYNRSSNISTNLSGTGANLSLAYITTLAYSPTSNVIYIGGLKAPSNSYFAVYNVSSNITTDLSRTAIGDWMNGSYITTMTYSSKNDLLYIGLGLGKFGVYNRTSNVTTNLSMTDVNDWVGVNDYTKLSYDLNRNIIFMSVSDNKLLGVYSIVNNLSYNISSRLNTVINTSVVTMDVDTNRSIVYIINSFSTNLKHFGMFINSSNLSYLSALVNFTLVAQKNNASTNVTSTCYNNESMNVTYNLTFNNQVLLYQFLAPNITTSNLSQLVNGFNNASLICTNILGESAFMTMSQSAFNRKYSIFDENTLAPITSNVTITFTSNTTQYIFNTNTSKINVTIPSDNYNVMFQTAGYSVRYMTLVKDVFAPENISVYLSNTSTALTLLFVDKDLSTMPLSGVYIQMYRMIGGVLTLVESQYSDITGRAVFDVSPYVQYTWVCTLTGYIPYTFSFVPSYTPVTVAMTKDVGVGGLPDYGGVQATYTPTAFFSNTDNNISFRFFSGNGILLTYGYTVTYPSGVISGSGVLSKGEIFTTNFTIGNVDESATVNITYFYNATYAGYRSFSFSHGVNIVRQGTLMYNKDRTFGLGILDRVLIGSIVIIFIVGLAGLAAGLPVGLALGLLTAGIFIYIGFLPYWAFILTIFLGFLILLWRSDI